MRTTVTLPEHLAAAAQAALDAGGTVSVTKAKPTRAKSKARGEAIARATKHVVAKGHVRHASIGSDGLEIAAPGETPAVTERRARLEARLEKVGPGTEAGQRMIARAYVDKYVDSTDGSDFGM